jgi:hypothetical protein
MVHNRGDECATCNTSVAANSRSGEKRMEFTLQQWAMSGHIPEYTLWNKEIAEADSAVCGKIRPDFTFVTDSTAIVMEFDEHQHEHYDRRCELVRMANMFLSYRGRRVTFIRYNPDAFKLDDKTLVTKRETREAVLLEVLKESLTNADFSNTIIVHYVCYDKLSDSVSNYVRTFKFADILAYQAWVEAFAPA